MPEDTKNEDCTSQESTLMAKMIKSFGSMRCREITKKNVAAEIYFLDGDKSLKAEEKFRAFRNCCSDELLALLCEKEIRNWSAVMDQFGSLRNGRQVNPNVLVEECLKRCAGNISEYVDDRVSVLRSFGVEDQVIMKVLAYHIARHERETLELLKCNDFDTLKMNAIALEKARSWRKKKLGMEAKR